MNSHDIGLSSLAKAMGESIDADIARNLHSILPNATQYPVSNGTGHVPASHVIQGQMLSVRKIIPQETYEQLPHDIIKREMLKEMLEEMMRSKHIEFTVMKDATQLDALRITARVFVTPDSQVRLLRENGV